MVAIAVMFILLTMKRNEDYRSEERMWRDIMAKRPENVRSYIALSNVLLARGELDESSDVCQNVLLLTGRFKTLSRSEILKKGEDPRDPLFLQKAYAYACAHNNLGRSLFRRKRIDGAIAHYREAIRVAPGMATAHNNLASAYFAQGLIQEAAGEWGKALEILPYNHQARRSLALIFVKEEKYGKAIMCYEAGLKNKPDDIGMQFRLAWLLSACPDDSVRDGKKAVEIARKICQATENRSVNALDLLASAYAEAGLFEKAEGTAARAIELAREIGLQDARIEDIEQRLKLYRSRKAFHGSSIWDQSEGWPRAAGEMK